MPPPMYISPGWKLKYPPPPRASSAAAASPAVAPSTHGKLAAMFVLYGDLSRLNRVSR